jgi:hypothetical protein
LGDREVRTAQGAVADVISLNKIFDPQEGATEIGDLLEDPRTPDTADVVMREMERLGLHTAIERLPERVRHVLTGATASTTGEMRPSRNSPANLGSPGNGSGRCRRRPKSSSKPESTPACSGRP